MTLTGSDRMTWVEVCGIDDLEPDRGACALVAGEQVALFRVWPTDEVFAISNLDPASGAFVLSRGIVGWAGDVPKVASPMYKHCFDLRTGRCLSDPGLSVPVFPVRVVGGRVLVGLPA